MGSRDFEKDLILWIEYWWCKRNVFRSRVQFPQKSLFGESGIKLADFSLFVFLSLSYQLSCCVSKFKLRSKEVKSRYSTYEFTDDYY